MLPALVGAQGSMKRPGSGSRDILLPCGVTRRAAGALVAGGLALAATGAGASEPSLRLLGAQRGITVGTSYVGDGSAGERAAIARHAALVVPEWTMKPLFMKPQPDRPARFDETDRIVAFARGLGVNVHGHTLYWYADRFSWADDASLAVATHRYGRFVAEVVGHYRDVVSWDVFNEIVADDGPGLLRADALLSRHGLDFVAALFRQVHDLAPDAVLVLNDNWFECGGALCRDRRARALQLVDALRARGVPLQAFGIQSHLSSRDGLGLEGLMVFVDQLAQRGLDVFLSELDVNDVDFADDIRTRDRQVADMYHAYLTAVLRHPAVKRLVFWGLGDGNHWLVRRQQHPGRAAGQGRPAPFDADWRPKPAFFAVADALSGAPVRT
jgi:endo-1,4-beta-xylanase